MSAALINFRGERFPIKADDVSWLSPLVFSGLNLLRRQAFPVPDSGHKGELPPLRERSDTLDDVA